MHSRILRSRSGAAAAMSAVPAEAPWALGDPPGTLEALAAGVAAGDILAGARACVLGTITARRVHGRGLMFADLLPWGEPEGAPTQQLAVDDRRAGLACSTGGEVAGGGGGGGEPSSYDALVPLLSAGAVIRVEGAPGRSRTGHATLFVRRLALLRVAPQPPAVLRVCRMLAAGALPPGAAAGLLGAPEARVVAAAAAAGAGEPAAAREARRLARRLAGQPETLRPPRVRAPRVRGADAALLARLAPARAAWPVLLVAGGGAGPLGGGEEPDPCWVGFLDPQAREVCLPDPGVWTDARRAHYVTTKKRPQVVWMVRQVCARRTAMPGSGVAVSSCHGAAGVGARGRRGCGGGARWGNA